MSAPTTATSPAGRRVKAADGYRFDHSAIAKTASGVSDPDDFVQLLRRRGAAKVLMSADGAAWRCRAWHGGIAYEGRHASRGVAASICALAYICGQHGMAAPVEVSEES